MSDKENDFLRELASRRGRVPEVDSATKLHEIAQQFRVTYDDHPGNLLYHAIQYSRLDIVEQLIEESNVDVNGHDHSGRTYLSVAVDVGNERIVDHLLSVSNIRVDAANQDGTTPLWRALNKLGFIVGSAIVESLIQKGDINLRSIDGDHALLWEIKRSGQLVDLGLRFGNPPKSVLSLLLNRKDLDVNQFDPKGRGALSLAVDLGNPYIFNKLLEREDIRVNICDHGCRTPLSLAAENCRYPERVRALLSHPEIDACLVDKQGRTPLIWSIISHNLGVVELLLERESRLLNIPDSGGRTPLSWAAGNGTWEITKNLLQREGVDKDSKDHCGRTALSWAAENNSQLEKIRHKFGNSLSHNHILKSLIEEEGINNNSKDNDGRTPLSWAATKADLLIVKYLVSSGCVSVDEPDIIGRTPLSWSAEYQRSEVVDFLLSAAGVNPNLEDQRGRTPLYWATREDNLKVMRMLIRKDIDTLKKMVKEGPEQPERVKLLLDAGYDACKLDNYGRTPLYHAVAAENVESTKLLISSGPKSITSRDNYGITPLKVAVGTSQVLAKILIENGATTNDIQPKEWFHGNKSSVEEIACLSDQGAIHSLQYMTGENLTEEVSKPLPADHERRRLM
ncbi:unnamed protein product [Fusarium equiseti]|uniref:Ankyrin repeat protein n=1 Tax=Fusarium equiseti TaxID=61235 RepID=A0A8J2IJM4_FUSEQ|nr:unnamed protein product [Fusarium equiseti]